MGKSSRAQEHLEVKGLCVLLRGPGWSYWLLQEKVPSNWSWCSQELQGLQGLRVETRQTGFVGLAGQKWGRDLHYHVKDAQRGCYSELFLAYLRANNCGSDGQSQKIQILLTGA